MKLIVLAIGLVFYANCVLFYNLKAINWTIPDTAQPEVLEDGIIVPLGKLIQQTGLHVWSIRSQLGN